MIGKGGKKGRGLSQLDDYDPDNQLTGDGSNTWDWDPAGNQDGLSLDSGNRVMNDGTWDYTYDDEGNVTYKEDPGSHETWHYEYNQLNQLMLAEHDPDGFGGGTGVDLSVTYAYDVFNNRIERAVDDDGVGGNSPVIEDFAYDHNGNAWADLDYLGSLITRRLYMNAVDALFARIDSNPVLDWYLTDRLGSVRDIMDSAASDVQDHLDYFGFGKVSYELDPGYGDRYKYTSREYDVETDLQYNRARWYDAATQRWLSEDPIRFDAGDSNLYRYVLNTPTLLSDSSGLSVDTTYTPLASKPYKPGALKELLVGPTPNLLGDPDWGTEIDKQIEKYLPPPVTQLPPDTFIPYSPPAELGPPPV